MSVSDIDPSEHVVDPGPDPRTHTSKTGDYTVGWVCALPLEVAAAKGMLDRIHPNLSEQDASDHNNYILGEVEGHNVVIAGLPAGIYGTTSAATVAKDLLRTFKSIRFGLMVGIGGAAPSASHDIRLGDIVVGMPTGTSGGVIQYDRGKTVKDEEFERTGMLNTPPTVLLTALARLQADQLSGDCRYPDFVSQFLDNLKKPKIRKKFSYQGESNDCLFRAEYDHDGSELTCVNCDRTQTVQREPRDDTDPLVHYGNIVSGNQVIKNGVVRDSLSKRLGVLCFEMGAAQEFPCLVIRGICDYADSHRNKTWQEYAALTAAAFAKELLTVISSTRIVQDKPIPQMVSDPRRHALMSDTNTVISEHARKQELRYEDEKHAECHRIFKTSRYQTFKDNNPERVQHTCKWVLEHPQYQRWHNSPIDDLLWISADPGCGKSVLARSLIDNELRSNANHNVCYFFFKVNEDQDSLEPALCALLHQLFSQQTLLTQHAMEPYAKNGESIRKEIDEMWGILLASAMDEQASDITCVLDALDECREIDRQKIIRLLTTFYTRPDTTSTRRSNLTFLVTSRPYQNIESGFRDIPPYLPSIRLAGEESNADISKEINLVIKYQVIKAGWSLQLSQDVQNSLQERLLATKNRTYLWVHLVMEEVKSTWGGKRTEKALMKKVDLLPESVESAYERILSRHSRGQHSEAKTLLHIVVGARRPLTLSEMDVAFQIATESPNAQKHNDLDLDREYLQSRIRELCGLFVFIKDERVYLLHQTAKEFLVKELHNPPSKDQAWAHSLDGQVSNQILTQICVRYLSFSDIEDHLFLPAMDEKDRLNSNSYPFLDYSAIHWPAHFRDTTIHDENFTDLIYALYKSSNPRFTTWVNIMSKEAGSKKHWHGGHILCLAASNGHNRVIQHMLDTRRRSVDSTDNAKRTPLIRASSVGHEHTVRFLIRLGANVNHEGGEYGNPLQSAVAKGHSEIAKLLVQKGARTVAFGGYYGTALIAASYRGDDEMASFLVNNGADAKSVGGRYGSALIAAACGGHITLIHYLTEHGADINTNGGHYESALIAACYGGHDETIHFLLKGGADINTQGGWHGNALQAACCGGHYAVVQLLIAKGADINAIGGVHYHALHGASCSNHVHIAELLIQNGADVNVQGGEYGSAFQAAAYRGYIKMLELLADHGADIDMQGWHASALEIASGRGHSEIVDFLLQKGARLENTKKTTRYSCTQHGSALMSASVGGHEEIVKALLLQGADPGVHSEVYSSCLQAAAHQGHEEIVRILLDHGLDVNTQGGPYCTALIAAVCNDHRDIAETLIDHGADVNIRGGFFSTAYQAALCLERRDLQKLLTDHGADVDARVEYQHKPLQPEDDSMAS